MKNPSSRLAWRNFVVAVGCLAPLLSAAAPRAKAGTYPEIVRLTYVQGDVRFSRGDGKNPDLTKPWEQAAVNVPILKGYSVATGDGRARIEFEYGSMVYLAENSVLMFQTLSTKNGVPTTEMEVVTGTASISFHPIPKEVFRLTTPTETVQFTEPALVRVDGYLDGATVTIHGDGWDNVIEARDGTIVSDRRGSPGKVGGADQSGAPADWDAWVAAQVKERQEEMDVAMKAAGVNSFIPGLTDLYDGGTFFQCAPFGICWEPKELPAETDETPAVTLAPVPADANAKANAATVSGEPAASQATAPKLTAEPQAQPAAVPEQIAGTAPVGRKLKSRFSYNYYPLATCPTSQLRLVVEPDPVTGKKKVVDKTIIPTAEGWTWALCHSGAWVHLRDRGARYTFVVGKKRHHPPVCWVHTPKGDGYVPRHPSDSKGKLPLNLKYGVFMAEKGSPAAFGHVAFAPAEKYSVLKEAPKQVLNEKYPQLAKADRPEIHGRPMEANAPGAKLAAANTKATPITYDYKTQNFVRAGTPMAGRTSRSVVVGSLSAHGGYSTPSGGGGTRTSGGSGRASDGGTSQKAPAANASHTSSAGRPR